jgi:predicted MFS family arabinose efflux permease
MGTTRDDKSGGYRAVSIALFLCLFASQAALIAMAPVLTEAARDLHVSTAAAGQLRTITGLAAGITALMLGTVAGRVGLGRQLLAASVVLALASIASAAAPTFALLALAQLPVGVALAVLTTAGTLAAAEWVAPELRTRTLSWALVGQPAAWIVGMPVVGALGERSWRYGWLTLPLVAAATAAILVASRAGQPPAQSRPARARAALADRTVARWLASELLANAAWAGTLVFAGALFVESYGTSTTLTGCLLAVAAVAYVAGNLLGRRLVGDEPSRVLVLLAVLLALTDSLFGAARTGIATSTALFAIAAFFAGGRALVANAFALARPPEIRPAVTSLRAATMQFGYLAGSIAGGAALTVGGYSALGITMGAFFLGAAATLAHDSAREARPSLPALYRRLYRSATAAVSPSRRPIRRLAGQPARKRMTMKHILALLAIATVGMAASVSAAQADVITNDMTSIGFAGFVPCANGGAGEILSGRIDVHNLVTSTVNSNNVLWQFQFQPLGGSMVGSITGDKYRVAGVTRGTYNASLDSDHYTLTYVNTFQLIGPGSRNNLLVHEIAHVTINGDEVVVVEHDNLRIECT